MDSDSMHQLLVIDDDQRLCEMLQEYLSAEGFTVNCEHDGAAGLARLHQQPPDMLVLDVMLPGMGGLAVLAELRGDERTRTMPVLMLTAKGDEVDRIVGLEVGADDYLGKPFNPRELLARIRAILRRTGDDGVGPADERTRVPSPVSAGDILVSPSTLKASIGGRELNLTGAEFRVLELLVRQAGTVVSREVLTEGALGRRLGAFDRSIDTHVSNLRRKLGRDASGDSPVRNVRGSGYLLVLKEPDAAAASRAGAGPSE